MDFRILGPLEVHEQGRALELGGARQRALLAALLLNANRVVSADQLIDAVWDEQPPETAQKALQVRISQLRKLLGHARIVTRPPGYLIQLEPGELDLERFEELVQLGGADRLREALVLWRGPPLADVAGDRFARADVARLEELRLAALEERIEADLALGRHLELVPELEALVLEHPLRDRLRGQLLLALYRSGRQADALEAYRDARRALVDGLGIEPSRALQRLQQAMLSQDPSLELDAERSPRAAADVLVGRERELRELRAALDDALRGRGGLVLVAGAPGIGKTRLLDELVAAAREHKADVLIGRCWEAGGAPAYWPWVQSLRAYVRDRGPDELRRLMERSGVELTQLLPELAPLVPDSSTPSDDPEGARFRLFDTVTSFLVEAATAQPLVLVLDDLHAADTPSLLLLRFLADALPQSRILVLAAYRDLDPTLPEPLAETVVELARNPTTRRIALGGLAAGDVAELIRLRTETSPPTTLVSAIYEETEGNPLFVVEVVRLLAEEGRLEEAPAGAGWPIPQSVREVIEHHLHALSAEARDLLTLAAVLGREFDVDALEHVSALPPDELLDLLDEAAGARVVGDVPGAPRRVRFTHVLLRDTIYEGLTATRRVRLHGRVAAALEELYGADPEPQLAELAHHFLAAAPGGDSDKALAYARLAAERAAALIAFEEAIRLYGLALQALDSAAKDDPQARTELLLGLGDVQARAGDSAAARESFVQAADLSRGLEDAEGLARAALGYGGRTVVHAAGRDLLLVSLLEEALASLPEGDGPLRARCLARLAGALRDQPERELREQVSAEGLAIARRLGDPVTLAYALDGRLGAIWWPARHEERLELAGELIDVAEAIGDRERAFFGRGYRMYALLELGRVDEAYAEIEQRSQIADELRQPAEQWLVAANRGLQVLFEGRFEEAEERIPRLQTSGARTEHRDTQIAVRNQLVILREAQGRLAEFVAELERAADPSLGWLLAYAYSSLGREDAARSAFEAVARTGFADVPWENDWLFAMCLLSEVCAALGDAERAATLYGLLVPYSGLNVVSAPELAIGSADRWLGLLAATTGRNEDAKVHFEQALQLNERMGARPWLERTQRDYERLLSGGRRRETPK